MPDTRAVLEAKDLRLLPEAAAFSETVFKREIVGLAGLDGHGQAHFLETLAGERPPAAGNGCAPRRTGYPYRIDGRRRAGKGRLPAAQP